MIPQIVYAIIGVIASLISFLGLAAIGLGIGYLAVDLLQKAEEWPFKAIIFLGLTGLVIAMVVFLTWGSMGGFGIGLGAAVFLWGMPRKREEPK